MFDFLWHLTREDLVTSVFDAIFVYSGVSNVRQLVRDKQVKGFDWRNMALYALWNIWTIFVIYPHAALYLANVINSFYLLTQIVWLTLYVRYRRSKRFQSSQT